MSIWDKQYNELGFMSQRLYPNEELLRFLGGTFFARNKYKRKKIRILELGCGTGANLWMIAKEGFSAYGIDFSKPGLRLCKKMLRKWNVKAKVKFANMLDIPFPDNYFDAIVDVVSMQHISFSNHTKAYAEIKRLLKKKWVYFFLPFRNRSFSYIQGGGVIVDNFTVDNIKNHGAPLANNGITCFPTEKAIENQLNSLQYKNISIENVIKTYSNRRIKITYLVIKAQK